MTSALPIDMVSDVVCPWCFIGKRRLEKAIALRPDIPVEVRFRPYFLNPWVPREGISRNEYLTTKFGSPEHYRNIAQRVALAAAAEGLTYKLDEIKRQPNTLDCHRLILTGGRQNLRTLAPLAMLSSVSQNPTALANDCMLQRTPDS